MKRGGLGRGLSALIPGAPEEGGSGLLEVPVNAIKPNPRQPRSSFDEDALEGLVASIRSVGVLQPIVLRRRDDGYEVIAGERRLRASRQLGLTTIPALVRDSDDVTSLQEALIENIHRADLGPIELAEAYRELLEELGTTQEEVADRLGISRPAVANTIRLLGLPEPVQSLLAQGRIQAGHGRALLALPDPAAQEAIAVRVAAEDLSVREVEDLVRRYQESPRPRSPRGSGEPAASGTYAEAEERLADRLGTRVRIQMGARRGKIVVDVGSAEDLDRIIGILTEDT
jgi:ParB family chromosome partitioning protein